MLDDEDEVEEDNVDHGGHYNDEAFAVPVLMSYRYTIYIYGRGWCGTL